MLGEIQSFEKVDMNILEMSEELETFVTSTIDCEYESGTLISIKNLLVHLVKKVAYTLIFM